MKTSRNTYYPSDNHQIEPWMYEEPDPYLHCGYEDGWRTWWVQIIDEESAEVFLLKVYFELEKNFYGDPIIHIGHIKCSKNRDIGYLLSDQEGLLRECIGKKCNSLFLGDICPV